jgi:anti-anti-sigma factor
VLGNGHQRGVRPAAFEPPNGLPGPLIETRLLGGSTDRAVLLVRGELDIATEPALRSALLDARTVETSTLAVDLSGVAFVDVRGIAPILEESARLRRQGRRMVVRSPSRAARLLLDALGQDWTIEIERGHEGVR